jgi:hypothetical protein
VSEPYDPTGILGPPSGGPDIPGNIDVGDPPFLRNVDGTRRATVINKDGSFSSTRSISISTDKGEVAIPTVVDGKVVSNEEAIAHYRKTGENLGTFGTARKADAYTQSLHEDQARHLDAFDPTGILSAVSKPGSQQPVMDGVQAARMAGGLSRGDPVPAAPDASQDSYGVQAAHAAGQLHRDQDALQASLMAWRAANDKTDPARRAQVLLYSAASGHLPAYVEQNFDEVKGLVDSKGTDWGQVQQRQPILARLLSEKPETIPIVRDDLAHMGTLEWFLTQPLTAAWDAIKEQEAIGRQDLEALGSGSPENRTRIEQILQDSSGKDYGARNLLTQGVIGAAKAIPFLAGNALSIFAGATGGAAVAAPAGVAAGAETGPGALAAGAAATVPGAVGGGYLGSAVFNAAETLGPAYWQLSHIPGVDPDVARQLSMAVAIGNGAIGGLLGSKYLNGIPAVKKLMGKMAGSVMEQSLAEKTVPAAIRGFLLKYPQHVATGATLIAAQGAATAAAEEMARAESFTDREPNGDNIARAYYENLKGGLRDLWLLSAFGPAQEAYGEIGRARAVAEDAVKFQGLVAATANSKTLERHPETFHSAVEKMAPDTTIGIPVEQWTTYWQGKKIDPGEVAATIMGDGGKGYSEAVQTKGDISIPAADLLTKLGKTDHLAALAQDVRFAPDLPTQREQADEDQRRAERMAEIVKGRGDELTAGKEAVFSAVRDQAIAAGIPKDVAEANAAFYREHYGAMAVITGRPVEEVAAIGGFGRLSISGPGGAEAEAGARSTLASHAQAAEQPRGTISMALEPGGKPASFDIRVLAGDKSTFAHETGHFLSWSMHELAAAAEAPEGLKTDYAGILKFMGYASPEERVAAQKERAALEKTVAAGTAADAERSRLKALTAKEEKFSHAWEQYLAEGKAPSEALRSTFSRFKKWLNRIYRGIPFLQRQFKSQYGEDLNLSPEVRGIFDRLLAADDALSQAEKDTGSAPAPEAEALMTDKQREEYRSTLDGSRRAAELSTMRAAIEDQKRRVVEARTGIEAQVTTEVDADPVYRAVRFLQRGELATGGTVLSGAALPFAAEKLSRPKFVSEFGADAARAMPTGVFEADKKAGLAPDEAAARLGFHDGRELATKLSNATPRDQLIADKVQARIDAQFGPEQAAIQEAALAAVHNDDAFRAQAMELRALAKDVNPEAARRVRTINKEALDRTAGRLIGETRVADLKPAKYARAERTAALKAAELWGKGEKEAALDQREARLLNGVLWREARDTKAELEKARAKLEAVTPETHAKLGLADKSYLDLHDQLLGAVGLGEAVKGDSVQAALSVAALNMETLDVDEGVLADVLARPRDWSQLTANEARSVASAAEQLKHVARQRFEVDVASKRVLRSAYFEELAASAGKRPPVNVGPYGQDKGPGGKAASLRRAGSGFVQSIETWCEMLDGGPEGPAHRLFLDGQRAARYREAELTERVTKAVKAHYAKMPKEMRNRGKESVDVADLLPSPDPSRDAAYTRDRLYMLFLNWGNDGNRQRVMDGNGWSQANVEKALSLLKPQETDFLQGLLDTIQLLGPDLAEVHFRRTGERLDRVEASAIKLNDGREYRGGYFPLRYDKDIEGPGSMQATEDQIAGVLQRNNARAPSARSGATKSRLDKVNAPVDLRWGVVQGHLIQVIHDISYGDWVRETAGIILDKRFKDIVTRAIGEERYKLFRPWLVDVANARADAAAVHQADIQRVLPWMRSKFATSVMALNVPSLMRHATDPLATLADSYGVAPHRIARAYLKVLNPLTWSSPELADSRVIAYKDSHYANNLRQELTRIGSGKLGAYESLMSATLFQAHHLVDKIVSRVTYLAAKDQALAEGLTVPEARDRADNTLERNIPTNDLAEKTPLQRDRGLLGSLAIFSGYASRIHNLRARAFERAFREWNGPDATMGDRAVAVGTVAGKYLALGAVAALGAYLAGRSWRKKETKLEAKLSGHESPQKEDPAMWATLETLLAPLDDLSVVGPITKKAISGLPTDVAAAPEAGFVGKIADQIGGMFYGKRDDSAIEQTVELLTSLSGATMAVKRGASGIKAIEAGKSKGAFDAVGKVLYGDQSKDGGTNPLSDLQKAINGP